jgi:hypothetical protein
LFIASRFTIHAYFPRSLALTQLRFTLLTVTSSQPDLQSLEIDRNASSRLGSYKSKFQTWMGQNDHTQGANVASTHKCAKISAFAYF